MQTDDQTPTILGIPLNRILTIGRGPINLAASSVATWLFVHVHFLGLFHVQHDGLSTAVAQGFVFLLTAVLTDRGLAQWVKGHHIELAAQNGVVATEEKLLLDHYLGGTGEPEHQTETSGITDDGPTPPVPAANQGS
jgi:hypothetical protein